MRWPRTRIDEGTTDFERSLLRSWSSAQPSDEARQKTLALITAGSTMAATVATATMTTNASAGAGLTGVAPKAAAAGVSALGKWVMAATVVAATSGVTVMSVRRSSPAPAVATSSVTAAPPLPPSFEQPRPVAPSFEPPSPEHAPPPAAPVADDAPPVVAAPRPSPRVRAPAAASSTAALRAPPRLLGEEVFALDAAHRALDSGDARAALARIDDFERRFPRGLLAEEATALRIEALTSAGERDAARELAERFLREHPTSPHAARVRLALAP